MASTESGRQMYPSFKEAHEAFVAEYTALYQGFPKYLEDRSGRRSVREPLSLRLLKKRPFPCTC